MTTAPAHVCVCVLFAHGPRRRLRTVVPCASHSGDMGRARTLHSSRDVLFGSSLLIRDCGIVRQSFLGPWRPWRLEMLNALLT